MQLRIEPEVAISIDRYETRLDSYWPPKRNKWDTANWKSPENKRLINHLEYGFSSDACHR